MVPSLSKFIFVSPTPKLPFPSPIFFNPLLNPPGLSIAKLKSLIKFITSLPSVIAKFHPTAAKALLKISDNLPNVVSGSFIIPLVKASLNKGNTSSNTVLS